MPPRAAASPKPARASSRLKDKVASEPKKRAKSPSTSPPKSKPTPKSSKKASSASVAATVSAREAELTAARNSLSLFKTPLVIISLFGSATAEFLVSHVKAFATSKLAFGVLYPLAAAYAATKAYAPGLYTAPDCAGGAGGLLFYPQLAAYEALWWLVLGILSSIGLGTGLHSGLMFLWPFVMSVVLTAEACQSTSFISTYNHPCTQQCDTSGSAADGTLTYLNTLVLLWPSVVLWGSGTAIGELPPYFITRAAKRAGARATDYEAELAEAAEATDLVSRLKVWTIDFTERHGFVGILLLASWPNAAFDMYA